MDVVCLAGPGDCAWDAYVKAHPEGTLFHESAWGAAVEEVYRHPCLRLAAMDGGRILGVLPLVHVKSFLFGSRLVSTAFGIYGGILADSPDTATALAAAARELARERGARWVELRGRRPLFPELPVKDLYVTFRIPLAGSFPATLTQLPKRVRQDLRRMDERGGFQFREDVSPAELHELYLHTLRWHGTPAFPRAWLEALQAHFRERCLILGAEREGRLVGASMLLLDRGSLMPLYTGVPRAEMKHRTLPALHAREIRLGTERGLKALDLGRSKKGTGAFEAKSHWGVDPEPLGYQYLLPPGAAMPDLTPLNPRLRPFIALWKRLPLAATRILGPPLNASLA